MKLTKPKLRNLIKEELGNITDKKAAMKQLFLELIKAREQAKKLQLWDLSVEIDKAAALLEDAMYSSS